MKTLCIATLVALFSVLSANAAVHEKHLFVLSGQSNMAGLDPNISFTPTVESAFGKQNVTVVKDAQPTDSRVFNISEFGAVGDGTTLNTTAIQSAIDACNEAGGGMVCVPAGRFVIGTVHLKSNVTLSLDHGAEILGSQNLKDYPIDALRPSREGNSECLLYAE